MVSFDYRFDLPPRFKVTEKLFVLTDLHGDYARLTALLSCRPADATLLFLGDAIDRGPCSFEVIERLRAEQAVMLWGNHEALMWLWLQGTHSEIDVTWYLNGMQSTLDSIQRGLAGREPDRTGSRSQPYPAGQTAAEERLSAYCRDYLESLQRYYLSGNVFFGHSFPRFNTCARDLFEAEDFRELNPDSCLWNRSRSLQEEFARPHYFTAKVEIYCVFGHTPVPPEKARFEHGFCLDFGEDCKGALLFEPLSDHTQVSVFVAG